MTENVGLVKIASFVEFMLTNPFIFVTMPRLPVQHPWELSKHRTPGIVSERQAQEAGIARGGRRAYAIIAKKQAIRLLALAKTLFVQKMSLTLMTRHVPTYSRISANAKLDPIAKFVKLMGDSFVSMARANALQLTHLL